MSMQDRVIKFLSEFSGVSVSRISMETLVSDDLGINGDDGAELLAEFSEKFSVDMSQVKDVYFGPEGFNPLRIIFTGFMAVFSGLVGKTDTIKPLPVKQLVKSAEVGQWVNI